MVAQGNFQGMRLKAPQLIAVAIVAAVIVYVVVLILEDTLFEGTPLVNNPVIAFFMVLTHNVTAAVRSWGYCSVFGLMILESSSLPIPSEVILPFAGYLISAGQLDFLATTAVATVAGVLGALVDYYIGLRGVSFLSQRRVLGRFLFSKTQIDVVARWFNRRGALTVFASRLVPGLRTIVSFPAGAAKMPLARFIIYTAAGCLIWNGLLIYLGYFLGARWQQVAGASHYIIIVAFAGLLVAFVLFLIRRRMRVGRKQSQQL